MVTSRRERESTDSNMTRVVDLFAGCGGMSLGFEKAGFSVVAAFDAWAAAARCYSSNFDHHIQEIDLSKVKTATGAIGEFQPDLIIGGPPCQDFSSAGNRKERSRADLTLAFAQIVSSVKPTAFVMENVERARLSEAYKNARPVFLKAGYALTEVVLDASHYGVPQARKRFFCIGLQASCANGLSDRIASMATTDKLSVRGYLGMEFGLERYYRHPRNYNRRAIYSIDEPSATIRGVNRPVPPGYLGHRLDAGAVTPDLRSLSTLERARVQTFPKTFVFDDTKSALELMIGNAVPVELARSVASALRSELEK
jgi:DNA (cytosine-5)-methyltransferase 1